MSRISHSESHRLSCIEAYEALQRRHWVAMLSLHRLILKHHPPEWTLAAIDLMEEGIVGSATEPPDLDPEPVPAEILEDILSVPERKVWYVEGVVYK